MHQQIIVKRPGGLDQIAVVQAETPEPGPHDAVVRVLAAGAAFGDVLLRSGLGGGKFPLTPGYDLVGEIVAVGAATTRFKVGDRVAALPGLGAQQEFVRLAESELTAVPSELTPEVAVALVLNYTTAYQLLTRAAKLQAGDTAFIYGLAGGLGLAVQQVARQLGITVYGTASKGKHETARKDGAVVFDRDEPDLNRALRSVLNAGVKAVFDPIGGASLNRSYSLLAPHGVLVLLGAAAAVQGQGNAMLQLVRTLARFVALKFRPGSRKAIIFTITQSKQQDPAQFQKDLAQLFEWARMGKISPTIYRVLPLSEARRAQELLERSQVTGKIVLNAR